MELIQNQLEREGWERSANLRMVSKAPAVVEGALQEPASQEPNQIRNPKCDADGVWRCCGAVMDVRPLGNYRAFLCCALCGWNGEGRNYPNILSNPFLSDNPLESLTGYQCGRLVNLWERDSVGARYRRGLWSRCAVTDAVREWHAVGLENNPTGLIFSGGMGTGKTVAMGLMTCCLAARNEFSFAFWNMSALLSFLHNWRDWGADHNADATMQTLRHASFLFLDDLGVEYNSPLAMSRFNELIETRYSRELHHVATSNLSEADLCGREGWARIVDRLQENILDWCELGGQSKRRAL